MRARRWALRTLASLVALVSLLSRVPAQAPSAASKPAAVVNGEGIPWAEVEAVLKKQGPTAVPATEAQRRQMQRDVVEMLIDDLLMQQYLRKHGPKVPPAEVNKKLAELEASLKAQQRSLQDFYKETSQTPDQVRQAIVTMLQWTGFVNAQVTDADLKRYYDENHDFFDQVTVKVSHIVLRVLPNASAGERQAARSTLLGLRQQLVSGQVDFAEAAKKHSQCPSAPSGGDLGFIARKFMVEEPFAKAAFALRVGEISEIVQTDYGVHLIKATERKPGQPSTFEGLKEAVREIYTEEMRLELLAKERNAARIEIKIPGEP
jgi:parvulin-like peptidyl-prolyl isomerase